MPRSSLRPTCVGRPAKRLRWIVSKRSAASFSTVTGFSPSPPLPLGERIEVRGGCSRDFSCEARLFFAVLRELAPLPPPPLPQALLGGEGAKSRRGRGSLSIQLPPQLLHHQQQLPMQLPPFAHAHEAEEMPRAPVAQFRLR